MTPNEVATRLRDKVDLLAPYIRRMGPGQLASAAKTSRSMVEPRYAFRDQSGDLKALCNEIAQNVKAIREIESEPELAWHIQRFLAQWECMFKAIQKHAAKVVADVQRVEQEG